MIKNCHIASIIYTSSCEHIVILPTNLSRRNLVFVFTCIYIHNVCIMLYYVIYEDDVEVTYIRNARVHYATETSSAIRVN